MDWYEFIAQAVGICGMVMNILSYQQRSQKGILLMQFVGGCFFAVNFYMLGAMTGFLMNVIGIIRSFVYYNKDKIKRMDVVNGIFVALFIASYFLTFTLFSKPVNWQNLLVECLPVVAMCVLTFGFYAKKASTTRKTTLIGSPLWLIYNVINRSTGGILCESFALCSVLIAIYRYDVKKK